MIHTINDERFTAEFVQEVRQALDYYLKYRPQHDLGLCRWLSQRTQNSDASYAIIEKAREDTRCEMPNDDPMWREHSYVAEFGQQHERVELAQRILNFLTCLQPQDLTYEEPDVLGFDSPPPSQDAGQVRETGTQCPPQGPRSTRPNHPR